MYLSLSLLSANLPEQMSTTEFWCTTTTTNYTAPARAFMRKPYSSTRKIAQRTRGSNNDKISHNGTSPVTAARTHHSTSPPSMRNDTTSCQCTQTCPKRANNRRAAHELP